jgi:type III secretory pathway component EscV
MIGNNKIKFVELSFLNNKLNEINIDYGSDAADAMEMLINIYGKPTNYNLLRGRILNKLDEINIRNSKITNPVMKGLNPIRAEEDIILSSTPYIWETRKIEITFILKSYLTNGANRYSEPIENTRNILNIITKDFQRYVLDVEQEIENKREELEFNNYQRIKKEKLNEF